MVPIHQENGGVHGFEAPPLPEIIKVLSYDFFDAV
jgi:hypothetical protein